jgi:hypothetical protein
VVLYRASSARFRSQYEQLEGQYLEYVRFVPETSFRHQILEFLTEASGPGPSAKVNSPPTVRNVERPGGNTRPAGSAGAFVLFLVDDAVFTRSFRLRGLIEALSDNADAVGYSLRLGRNTTQCYALGRPQSLPAFQDIPGGFLKYNWTRADGDFAYPLEISSSIYRLETITDLVRSLDFSDPSTLESQMALQSGAYVHQMPALLCQGHSLAFSTPINRVQQTYRNRSGQAGQYSPEALADRFDLGERIDVDALEGFVSTSCHQEVDIPFEQRFQ